MRVLQLHEDDNGGGNEDAGPIGTTGNTSSLSPDLLDAIVPDMTKHPLNDLVIEDEASQEVTLHSRHSP
jgi:hypothetical protein